MGKSFSFPVSERRVPFSAERGTDKFRFISKSLEAILPAWSRWAISVHASRWAIVARRRAHVVAAVTDEWRSRREVATWRHRKVNRRAAPI